MLNVNKEIPSIDNLKNISVSNSLTKNVEILNSIFGNNKDLASRSFTIGRESPVSAIIFYIETLTDSKRVDLCILQPLIVSSYATELNSPYEIIKNIYSGNVIASTDVKIYKDMENISDLILRGDVVLFIDGFDEALIIRAKGSIYRPVSEAQVETVVRGPRDSFNEVLNVNISLIRRRIHNPNLIFQSKKVGNLTHTEVSIAYIKGICEENLINDVIKRIDNMKEDIVLGDSYIEELINDKKKSIFPQMRNTERPDVASAALLEGRIVILVDASPIALIAPGEFFSLMQSAEDYYNRYYFSSLVRLLRYFSLFIATVLPPLYIAIVNFHQQLIPLKLLISIITSRNGVPLPNFLEAILMELTFEILREAGVRLPKPVGQAVSIVGALVIGQAAVQASLVSPLMVIVVSLTGIATFTIPQYNISLPIRIIRFILMMISAILGLYGLMLGLMFLLIHMCSVKSFGTPYMSPLAPFNLKKLKDTLIRVPEYPSKKHKFKNV